MSLRPIDDQIYIETYGAEHAAAAILRDTQWLASQPEARLLGALSLIEEARDRLSDILGKCQQRSAA